MVLIKSTNINNINNNLEALDFTISKDDMEKLNNFEHQGFNKIKIDWSETGNGILIDQLANQF